MADAGVCLSLHQCRWWSRAKPWRQPWVLMSSLVNPVGSAFRTRLKHAQNPILSRSQHPQPTPGQHLSKDHSHLLSTGLPTSSLSPPHPLRSVGPPRGHASDPAAPVSLGLEAEAGHASPSPLLQSPEPPRRHSNAPASAATGPLHKLCMWRGQALFFPLPMTPSSYPPGLYSRPACQSLLTPI